MTFNIPPQELGSALNAFADRAGLRLLFPSNLVTGRKSVGLSGTFTPDQGLSRLLSGSGLTYRFTSARAVTIGDPRSTATGVAVAGAISLDTINVQGNDQSAYGPGVGYVATRSAAGTKSDTPIIETPQSISVVTRKQMDDQKPQSINEALRYTPGIVAELNGTQTYTNQAGAILLRGFAPPIFLDGLKTAASWSGSSVDPYLLNRVEVLSGPASVLYGQTTPGGLINAVSKLPTDTPLHEVQLGIGNRNGYQGAFDLGGPIDKNGQFLYRLTGFGITQNSEVDYNKTRQFAIAPALTWRPDENTTFTILTKYINNPSTAGQAVPAYGSALPNPNGTIPRSFFAGDPNYNTLNQTFASIGYQFEHRFDETWSFRQNFRYEHATSYSDGLLPSTLQADKATLNRYRWSDDSSRDLILLDNQISAKFLTGAFEHNITFGFDYQRGTYKDRSGSIYSGIPPINVFAPTYYGITLPSFSSYTYADQTQDQFGLYAQDQIKAGNWRFLLGARGDWASWDSTSTRAGVSTTTTNSKAEPTWRVGAVYLFDNGLAPYASYSTSFYPQLGTTFDGSPFQPLTGQQYEAGIKYQPPGSSSFITASAYNLTEQNVLTPDPDPTHAGYSAQTGEIRARGIELSAHANISEAFSLIANYTYTDATNTQSNTKDTGITGITESTQGKRPVGVPENMASLWANYKFGGGLLEGFSLGGGVRYVGSSYGDDVNSFKVAGATLFDAVLQYDFGTRDVSLRGLKLQVNASNLFDKTYVAACVSSYYCRYGVGRTVWATLKYSW